MGHIKKNLIKKNTTAMCMCSAFLSLSFVLLLQKINHTFFKGIPAQTYAKAQALLKEIQPVAIIFSSIHSKGKKKKKIHKTKRVFHCNSYY